MPYKQCRYFHVDCNNEEAPTSKLPRDIQCNGTIKYISMCDERILFQCEDNKDVKWTYNGFPIVLNGVLTSIVCENTMPITECDCKATCGNRDECSKHKATLLPANDATSDTTVTSSSTNSEAKTTACPNSTTVPVLGALVGLLMVLLVIVSSGLLWTCWVMRMKREMKITSEQLR